MDAETCYFCGAPRTSDDHVPPRVFFPEQKDLPEGWPDLRKNLIEVPSCDEHNNRCSGDDEIAGYVVLLHEKSNHVALRQFATKTIRAFKRNPQLDTRVILDLRPMMMPDWTVRPVARIDAQLVARVMERVARGLYFHDFKQRWMAHLNLVADGMIASDLSHSPHEPSIVQFKMALQGVPQRGDNSAAFFYQWLESKATDAKVLRMVFYEGLGYFAVPDIRLPGVLGP